MVQSLIVISLKHHKLFINSQIIVTVH